MVKIETRNNQTFEFFPDKGAKRIPLRQFNTLIRENIPTHKSDGFDAKATNQMSKPPIDVIGRNTLRRHPTVSKNT